MVKRYLVSQVDTDNVWVCYTESKEKLEAKLKDDCFVVAEQSLSPS